MRYLIVSLFIAICGILHACQPATAGINFYEHIGDIPVPAGYHRIATNPSSFAGWLRRLPLKKNKTVFLYNGSPKANQHAQFAVIDIPVGNQDLQQCADAVMRLRAEYLFQQNNNEAIDFSDNRMVHYRLPGNAGRTAFDKYLQHVFARCGTASLEKQLLPVAAFSDIAAGDVLIKGGAPGHAMMVMDIAVNGRGEKIFLLAQSYMPAQDMHVVINPTQPALGPWFSALGENIVETPEWTFRKPCLRKWPLP